MKNYQVPEGIISTQADLEKHLATNPGVVWAGYGGPWRTRYESVHVRENRKLYRDRVINKLSLFPYSIGKSMHFLSDRNIPINDYNDNYLFYKEEDAKKFIESIKAATEEAAT